MGVCYCGIFYVDHVLAGGIGAFAANGFTLGADALVRGAGHIPDRAAIHTHANAPVPLCAVCKGYWFWLGHAAFLSAHSSGRFARTSASGSCLQTLLPHMRTCAVLVRGLPFGPSQLMM